jgi:hypothetical protein
MDHFRSLTDIGPIAEPSQPARDRLRSALALADDERTVLVGFGGIPLTTLPFRDLEALTGYRFLFDGPIPPDSRRFVSINALPFSFKSLLASVDIVMTKPGYGTLVEAVALHQPLVYVRRYNFADEPSLVDYLRRHGRGVELSIEDFRAGRWQHALKTAGALPMPAVHAPPITGAQDAAEVIAKLF